MEKTAVIFDKWLHTLGGGEFVACSMARVLKDAGYEVTLVGGKEVPPEVIRGKLHIDLSDIKFSAVWNDPVRLEKLTTNKDLFINASFTDFSFGHAKKNALYPHFPADPFAGVKGWLLNKAILPLSARIIKQVEFLTEPELVEVKKGYVAYLLGSRRVQVAFSNLDIGKPRVLKFSLFFENLYKTALQNLKWSLEEADILEREVRVDPHDNIIHFFVRIEPKNPTIYLNLKIPKMKSHFNLEDRVYLLEPQIISPWLPAALYQFLFRRMNARLGVGIFLNNTERLDSYHLFLANSEFTNKWIKNYWGKDGVVLYPPVEMLFEKHNLKGIKKENWICSIGRFVTSGHQKKQEVLVEAFKKLYDQGCRDWELHLIGGLGQEPKNLAFTERLRDQAEGYPIFFHFNIPRGKVEEVLLKAKIYWHATGYGENELKNPINFEHFGIAPVEAISAGCIPVLYSGGGLREIVKHLDFSKINLFDDIDELVGNTKRIIGGEGRLDQKKVFSNLKKHFSSQRFEERLLELVS